MIKILYLHGLDASPESDNVSSLKKENVIIISPLINYKLKDQFKKISHLIDGENYDGIIGHSIGGYLGYYLSNLYKIPALLFNPSFGDKSDSRLLSIPNKILNLPQYKKQAFVIGMNDNIVEPEKQMKGIKNLTNNVFFEDIGHDIPVKIKLKYFNKFIKAINAKN